MNFNVSEVVDRAWAFTKKDGLLLAVIIFGITILTSVICSLLGFEVRLTESDLAALSTRDFERITNMYKTYTVDSTKFGYVKQIIESALSVGIVAVVLGIVRGRKKSIDFSGYNLPVMTYVKYVGTEIIYNVIVVIGTLLCLVPGIFFACKLRFASIYILENPEAGIGDAFSASWRMNNGHFGSLLGLGVLAVLMVFAGLLCCCIGYFFAAALIMFMDVVAYSMLNPVVSPQMEAESPQMTE